jgi:hypothetical protein
MRQFSGRSGKSFLIIHLPSFSRNSLYIIVGGNGVGSAERDVLNYHKRFTKDERNNDSQIEMFF